MADRPESAHHGAVRKRQLPVSIVEIHHRYRNGLAGRRYHRDTCSQSHQRGRDIISGNSRADIAGDSCHIPDLRRQHVLDGFVKRRPAFCDPKIMRNRAHSDRCADRQAYLGMGLHLIETTNPVEHDERGWNTAPRRSESASSHPPATSSASGSLACCAASANPVGRNSRGGDRTVIRVSNVGRGFRFACDYRLCV